MISTSAEYKAQIKMLGRNPLKSKATITFSDGTVLNIDDSRIRMGGMMFDDKTSSSGTLEVGCAAIQELELWIDNSDDYFNDYDFSGAVIVPQVGLELQGGTTEWITRGKFVVYDPISKGSVITVVALDNMEKFDRAYTTNLSFPATLLQVLQDVCTTCGVSLASNTLSFPNSTYIVTEKPSTENTNCREIVAYCAQLAASYAKINNLGELYFSWYKTDLFVEETSLDGGDFSGASNSTVAGTSLSFDSPTNSNLVSLLQSGATKQIKTVQGKNICPTDFSEWESGLYSVTDGSKVVYSTKVRVKRLVSVNPSTVYFCNTNDVTFVLRTYGATGTFVRSIGAVANGTTFTTASNEYYIGISLNDKTDYAAFQVAFANGTIKPFICLNSESDKSYAPFIPNSPSLDYPAPITGVNKTTINGIDYVMPQTLYSLPNGTCDEYDAVSGQGTATNRLKTYNGSEGGWLRAGTNMFAVNTTDGVNDNLHKDNILAICDQYNGISQNTMLVNPINYSISLNNVSGNSSFRYLYFYDTSCNDDLANFKAKLSANPVTVLYQLATPAVITGTPQTIPTALHNAITNDGGGQISATYPNPYPTGDTADGGNFLNYRNKPDYDGGLFKVPTGYAPTLDNITNATISTDDVHVTGVQIVPKDDSKPTYFKGANGYVISIENNPLAQNNIDQLVANMAVRLVDFVFRPMSVDSMRDDPSVEAGDVAYVVDSKGNKYKTIISSLNFKINSKENFKADAESEKERQSTRYSVSSKAVLSAKEQTQQQITTYDLAVQQLASTLAMSMGTFQTVDKQDNGSEIVYLHDQPTLEGSTKIWKRTADAIAVSNDGGTTWRGMDASGNIVAAVLTVIGINANWINVGRISSPVNPRVYFDVSAGILAASKLISSDENSTDVYAQIGTVGWSDGSTSKGLGIYSQEDMMFYFSQIGKNALNDYGGMISTHGDLNIRSNASSSENDNTIKMYNESDNTGNFEFWRARGATASDTKWLFAGRDKTSIKFAPLSGNYSYIDLSDGLARIGTSSGTALEVNTGGGQLFGAWKVSNSALNMNGNAINEVDGINRYSGWVDLQNGRISFGTSGSERGSLDSGGWYGVFNNSSDRELKTNIEPADDVVALDKVNSLKFYSYNYLEPDPNTRMATITGYEGTAQLAEMQGVEVPDVAVEQPQVAGLKTNIGLMADEAPTEIMTADDTGKPVGINLYEYISLAAKAVQELSAKVSELEQRIAILENASTAETQTP